MGRVCVRILLAGRWEGSVCGSCWRVSCPEGPLISYPSGTGDSTSEIFIELLFMTGR